jgi:hypothetical protein
VATAYCSVVNSCCAYGTGQFNETSSSSPYGCLYEYEYQPYGGFMYVAQAEPFFSGGRMAYNEGAACNCLAGIASFFTNNECGSVDSATWNSIQGQCLAAEQGTAQVGEPCASSFECATGSFCTVELAAEPSSSSSLGTCGPILALGDPCTADWQCSPIQGEAPTAYCGSTNVCAAALGNGAVCANYDQTSCSSYLCSTSTLNPSTPECLTTQTVVGAAICSYFMNPDAGGSSSH